MNLDEARSVLGVSPDDTEKEIGKKFKKLAAKYHPDINKDPGSEEMSKKISEAYQVIKNPPPPISSFQPGRGPSPNNIWEHINNVTRNHQRRTSKLFIPPDVIIKESLTFVESMLGAKRDLKYSFYDKCEPCRGRGQIIKGNPCSECDGEGFVTRRRGNVIIRQYCAQCAGEPKETTTCSTCQGKGVLQKERSLSVNLPPGISNNEKINMAGMGSFSPINEDYDDAYIFMRVFSHDIMKRNGDNVESNVKLTYLQSLLGITKMVETIHGEKELKIEPGVRNHDIVTLEGLGLKDKGDHVFLLDIESPPKNKLEKLIKILQEPDLAPEPPPPSRRPEKTRSNISTKQPAKKPRTRRQRKQKIAKVRKCSKIRNM